MNQNEAEKTKATVDAERRKRYRNCSAAIRILDIGGISYSVMTLFDDRDFDTAEDKMDDLVG